MCVDLTSDGRHVSRKPGFQQARVLGSRTAIASLGLKMCTYVALCEQVKTLHQLDRDESSTRTDQGHVELTVEHHDVRSGDLRLDLQVVEGRLGNPVLMRVSSRGCSISRLRPNCATA